MANDSGEISVELTLLLNNLQKQARAAAQVISKEFGTASKISEPTEKAATAQDKMTRAVKETKKEMTALQKATEEWRKSLPPPQVRGIGFDAPTNKGGSSGRGAIVPWTGTGLATSATPKIPYPAPIVPTPQFRIQNLATKPTIPTTAKGGSFSMAGMSALSASGIPYISTLARAIFSPLGAAAALTAASILAMRSAIENARTIYTKSLTSGMGLGMSIKRGTLANAIGVSEAELFQFGSAIAYLQPKLRGAQEILNQTTIPLTQVSFEFQVLKANMGAMFAKIANEATPAIYGIIDALSKLVKWTTDHTREIVEPFNAVAKFHKNEEKYDAVDAFARKYALSYSGMHVRGKDDIAENTKFFRRGSLVPLDKAMKLFQKEYKAEHPDRSEPNLQPPRAFMKQMPASNWERMGLVIGGGGGTNYNQQTAKNTGTMTKTLEQILRAFTASKAHYNAQGLPSTP